MKVDALESFTAKLVQLNDSAFMRLLSAFVQKVEGSEDVSHLLEGCNKSGDVYTMTLGDYSLFFSIINNVWYFIDLINPTKFRAGIGVRNPRFNNSINPTFNHTINPTFNHTINPTFNHTINPTFNHTINPVFNHTINPTFNHTINPTFNHTINPTFNHTINPVFNRMINPTFNRNIKGFYIYDLKNDLVYYSVDVRDNIMLIFDYRQNLLTFFAVQRNTGYSVYNKENNKYVGYLESNKSGGYNWFDTNGNWLRFLV